MKTNMSLFASPLSRRAALRGIGLSGLAAVLVACGGGGNAAVSAAADSPLSANEQALLDAAKAEGTVTLYTSSEQSIVDGLAQAMKSRYGIDLQFQRLNSSQLAQRYTAEAQVNNVVADVALTGDPTLVDSFAQQGLLSRIDTVPAAADWPADFRTDYSAVVTINPYSMAINTDKVTTPPKDWSALTDPQYKGQLVTVDLNNVGLVAFAAWDMLRTQYGDDFLRQVGTQDLRLFDSGPSTVQQLAAGAGSIYFPGSVTQAQSMTDQGAPVKAVIPTDAPVTGVESPVFISAKAPHPNAAKLLVTFLMTPEGQKILNTVASSPNNTEGTPPLPAHYVRPDFASTAQNKQQLIDLLGL